MITLLPDDLEIERLLEPVRVSVLDATQHVRSPRHSTQYRTTRNLIIAGAAVAILTAGTIVAVASQQYIDSNVECYQAASLDSTMVGQSVDTKAGAEAADPIELCAAVWRNNFFDEANNNVPDPNGGTYPVPDLVACTLPSGAAAVFPREDASLDDTSFCKALGLADWGSD